MQVDKIQEFFVEMYMAHDKVKCVKSKIDKLRQSAIYISPSFVDTPKGHSNPQKLEDAIIEIADLNRFCENALHNRAKFDVFTCSLTLTQEKILSMRCELGLEWKEIACNVGMSVSSVQREFKTICGLALSSDLLKYNS